jgi:tripartite-type tricarboxylate transporter receptor subunit TctC
MRTWKTYTILCTTLLALTISAGAKAASEADDWPQRPIQIIVPYAPGGDSDFNARLYAKYLTPILGKSLAVVNVAAASGSIALRRVKDANPDGYTVFFGNGSNFELSQSVGLIDFSYEAFEVACIAGREPGHYVAVKGDSPWKTLQELVEDSKKNPGKIILSSSFGGTAYLVGALLNKNGAEFNIVTPSGGSSERLTALLGGHIHVAPSTAVVIKDYLASGQLRALGGLPPKRSRYLPDVPTIAEAGYPFSYQYYYVFAFPKGTPKAIVEKFAAAAEKVTTNQEYAEAIGKSFYMDVFFERDEETMKKLIQAQVDFVNKAYGK